MTKNNFIRMLSSRLVDVLALFLVFLSGCWIGALMLYFEVVKVKTLAMCMPAYCALKVLGLGEPTAGIGILAGLCLCVAWLPVRKKMSMLHTTTRRTVSVTCQLVLLFCVYLVAQWIGWSRIAFSDGNLGRLAEIVGVCCGPEVAVFIFCIEICCTWVALHCVAVFFLKMDYGDIRMVIALCVFLAVAAVSGFRVPPRIHSHFEEVYLADSLALTSIGEGKWWVFSEADSHLEFRSESSMVGGLGGPENEKRILLTNSGRYGWIISTEEEVYCATSRDTAGDVLVERVRFRVVDALPGNECASARKRLVCEHSFGEKVQEITPHNALGILQRWNPLAAGKISRKISQLKLQGAFQRNLDKGDGE